MKKMKRTGRNVFAIILAIAVLCTLQGMAMYGETTTAQAQTLTAAQQSAIREIQAYKEKFNPEDYDSVGRLALEEITAQAIWDIEHAESDESVRDILEKAKKKLDDEKTNEEKEQEWKEIEKKVQAARDTAIAELNQYLNKLGDYRPAQQTELKKYVQDGISEINRASSEALVKQKLEEAKQKIGKLYTAAQLTSILSSTKTKAKEELDKYKNAGDYRDAQKTELQNAIAKGKTAIDAATSNTAVATALKNAKANIDKIKTDAQLKKEEAAKKTTSKKTTSQKTNQTSASVTKVKTPKVKYKLKANRLTIKYTAPKNSSGFEYRYKLGKKRWIRRMCIATKSRSHTLPSLKKGKYTIQVRSFARGNGKRVYSKWTKAKTIKVKKVAKRKVNTNLDMSEG